MKHAQKKIVILGGCGYIGTVLSQYLLSKGFYVKVIDRQIYGNFLKQSKNLHLVNKDIREINYKDFAGYGYVIHLANIANDPSAELNPSLSWDINVLTTDILCKSAIKAKVKKIIFASSGSVYGIKKERNVTEDLELKPISIYNKTKMIAERILLSYKKEIDIVCIRPATVCGFSKRLRLDVSVNMLTHQAYKKNKITVLGGKQIRPNIHIKDLVRLFHFSLKKKIPGHIINAGFENLSILNLAKKIQKKIKCKIIVKKSNDPRSYRLSSNKLEKLGFKRKYNIDYAIFELTNFFESKNFKDKIENYNIKKLKKLSFE
jgi:nucleoside-diphosphate-sugar epimerase